MNNQKWAAIPYNKEVMWPPKRGAELVPKEKSATWCVYCVRTQLVQKESLSVKGQGFLMCKLLKHKVGLPKAQKSPSWSYCPWAAKLPLADGMVNVLALECTVVTSHGGWARMLMRKCEVWLFYFTLLRKIQKKAESLPSTHGVGFIHFANT